MKDTDNSKLTFIIIITFPSPFLSLITNQAVIAYLLQVTSSGRMDSLITVRTVQKASDRNINCLGFLVEPQVMSQQTPLTPQKTKMREQGRKPYILISLQTTF